MKPAPISNFIEDKEGIRAKVQAELTRLKTIHQPDSSDDIQHKIKILQDRLRLIDSYQQLTGPRLNNLEKIFKHYCTHVFKTGHRVNFDRIGYENQHLIIQRFFAMIMDFQLNQILISGEKKPAVDRNEIILLFKKCSANARNLEFLEFITCVERLFVMIYDGIENYQKKQMLIREEKAKRAVEAKRREKYKMQKAKAKELGLINVTAKDIQITIAASMLKQQTQKHENDSMVNDLMKNFEIVNPTDEVVKAASAIHQSGIDSSDELNLFLLTNEQKIQHFMSKIGIDNVKQIDKKIRFFEKANIRFTEVEELQKLKGHQPIEKVKVKPLQPLTSKEIIETHEQWDLQKQLKEERNIKRLLSLKEELSHRELQKNQSLLARSLSKEGYEQKKRKINESFEMKQKKLMQPLALQRITKRKQQEETIYYNLEMVHKSTPNQLPIRKISPERFIARDSSDSVFMEEYSHDNDRSPPWRGFSGMSRANSQLIESTKRRAVQMQKLQNIRVNRYPDNIDKHRRYLEKYLEKK